MAGIQQHDDELRRQRPDVSPGMLRRRYSVPETIMRKYRLAQQRSDSEDSGTATAPSPVHRPVSPASPASPSCSPSRASCASLPDTKPSRARCALRDREIMRRSTLLRRLWSRQGVAGPYASSGELRSAECYAMDCPGCYAIKSDIDSCKACEMNSKYGSDSNFDKGSSDFGYCQKMSGSWSPVKSQNTVETRGCECCKKLFQYSSKENRIPNGVPLHFSGPTRSPKRQRLETHGNINRANEMLRTAMRNSYEKMEESHKQKEATTDSLPDTSTTLEFSNSISIPSASTTFSSSLRTSENGMISSPVRGDRSSEMSSRYSKTSSNPSRSSNDNEGRSKDIFVRPSTTGSNILNESLKTPPSSNVKKRRQSVCIYMNAFERPLAEIKSESFTNSNSPDDVTLDDNVVGDLLPDGNQNHTPSSLTLSTKTLISEEQTKTSSSEKTDTANDGNGNAPSSSNTQFNDTTHSGFTKTPTDDGSGSGQYTNGTNNYIHDKLLSDVNVYENHCNLKNLGHNAEILTIKSNEIKNNSDKKLSMAVQPKPTNFKKSIENTNVEFLEIVVSETLNSSAFLESYKNNNISLEREKDKPKHSLVKKLCGMDVSSGKIELDEYVSFVLIESLNSMTEQLEEINASVDKNKQLNIIEKEIKVKLQTTGASPVADIVIDKSFLDKVEKNVNATKHSSKTIDFKLNDTELFTYTQDKSTDLRNDNSKFSDHFVKKASKEDNFNCENGNERKTCGEEVGNFVLKQIEQIIKKDFKSDHNLNFTSLPVADTHSSVSHFEISNVDVYIENLPQDNKNKAFETHTIAIVPSPLPDESLNSSLLTDILHDRYNSNISNNPGEIPMTKVGTATYYKTDTEPVLVPRFSAYPLSDSMEVNTSSEEDILKESDTGSLIDSLEDPNSPRVTLNLPKKSKYDKKLVRGDIITLLPENTQRGTEHSNAANEKSECFFIRLKDNEFDCQKENIIVADHMPESLKDKLYRRQRKRELHMEHIKKKRLRHMKRELERQKKDENIKANQAIEQDCITIMNRLLEQVTEKLKGEERHVRNKNVSKESHSPKKHPKMEKSKSDKYSSKSDLKDMGIFKIDKYGNTLYQQPVLQEFRHLQKHEKNNTIMTINTACDSNENNSSHPDTPLSPDLLGPKRVYQKSEFRDGNKRVEILEIIECLGSSPEFYSDDNGCATVTRWHRRSRIPIPIQEKVHRSSRSKNFQKAFRMNTPTTSNKPDRASDKSASKVDQLIADILIDALKDNGTNESKINFVKSPKERGVTNKEYLNQWPTSTSPVFRRASVPLQESPSSLRFRPLNTPRYTQKFDIIPEEKSSVSIESSVEDSSLARRTSLPNERINGCLKNDVKVQYNLNHNNSVIQDNLKGQFALSPTKRSILKNSGNQNSEIQSTDEKIKAPHSPLMKTLRSACTSPIPQHVSAATSPIPHLYLDREVSQDINVKIYGKKSLSSKGTKEGWIGFCRPSSRTPEDEGIVQQPDVIHCTVKAHR